MTSEKIFEEELKKSIEITNTKNTYKPSKSYKPSSLKCVRNMYYQIIGAPFVEEVSYNLVGITESGTDIHERMQKHIANMINNNYDCKYIDVADFINYYHLDHLKVIGKNGSMETRLRCDDLNMNFACDGIICYKGEYHIVELKTETSQKFQIRNSVADEHKDQGRAYSLIFGIPSVWFIYICRNNHDFKIIDYTPSEEEKKEIINKINLCNEHVSKKTLPDKHINNSVCQYCAYKSLCDSNLNPC